MSPQVTEFLAAWHKAVKHRDRELLSSIIAEGCELRSPVVWKPTADTDYLLHILMGVITVVEDFEYRDEWVKENEIILEFTGSVDGKGLSAIDRITLDENGKMVCIEVMMRPLNTLIEFATRMREHALAYKPETAANA